MDALLSAVLGRAGVVAGLVTTGVAVAGALLVPLHLWRPAVVLPVLMVVVAISVRLTRDLPSADWPRLPALATLAVVVGQASWTAATHADQLLVRRDASSYAQYTQWIAGHGGLPIDPQLVAFGGNAALRVTGFGFDSPAFYQVGTGPDLTVVPQFLVGAPAVLSLGSWTGDLTGAAWTGVQVVPAVLVGTALLTFAALARRAVGPRWTPLAVALLGLCLPVVHTGRSTLSEAAALPVLLTAAVLLGHRRWLLGGSVLGLAGLVRVDALREVTVVVAVAALLAVRRHPGAVRLATGAVGGIVVSALVWALMARPYLQTVSASLVPLVAATVATLLVSVVTVPLIRRRFGLPAEPPGSPRGFDRVDGVVAAATAGLGLMLVSRPLWQTVRQDPNDSGALYVAILQARQQLPVDGGRTYAEHSVDWVAWWLGWPAVAAAWAAVVVLTVLAVRWWRRYDPRLDRAEPWWPVPLAVGVASSVLVLLRPGITPDHPWADRRLVPTVLPLVALAATLALSWVVEQVRRRRPGRLAAVVVALGVGALAVPVGIGTAPFLTTRAEAGEAAAIARVCAALAPGDVVVAVEGTDDGHAQRSINEWPQVVRGGCGHPAAALRAPAAERAAAVAELAASAATAGHRLVLLTAQEDGATAEQVLRAASADVAAAQPPLRAVRLETIEDAQRLTRPPRANLRLVVDVWTQVVPAGG